MTRPVEFFARLLHLAEGAIEACHVIGGGVPAFMVGHADQLKIDLQRASRRSAGQTGFRSGSSWASGSATRSASGLMSCVSARPGDMTITPSSDRDAIGGRLSFRVMGISAIFAIDRAGDQRIEIGDGIDLRHFFGGDGDTAPGHRLDSAG